MRSRVVVQEVDSVLLALEFLSDAVQLLTVEVSGDRAAIRHQLSMDNSSHAPPDAQHHLLRMNVRSGRCHSGFATAEPLSTTGIVDVQDPLLIPSNEVAQLLAVAMGGDQIHARVYP